MKLIFTLKKQFTLDMFKMSLYWLMVFASSGLIQKKKRNLCHSALCNTNGENNNVITINIRTNISVYMQIDLLENCNFFSVSKLSKVLKLNY